MRISEVISGLKAQYIGNLDLKAQVKGFCMDSREAFKGSVFFALEGSKLDGHNFVKDALSRGAIAVVVNADRNLDRELPIIAVKDTYEALKDLARYKLARLKPKVVGITGSCGKTTTKEAVRSFLEGRYVVYSSPKSYNTEIGISITVLNAPDNAEILVLELGMNHRSEISKLVRIAPLDAGLITNIRAVHIGNFSSFEELKEAKAEIVEGLKEHATLVLNADDENSSFLRGRWRRILSFGIDKGACRAKSILVSKDKIAFDVEFKGKVLGRLELNIPGRHNVYNVLSAFTISTLFNVPFDEVRKKARSFTLPPMRLETHRLKNGVILINDAYNANPFSAKEAVSYLSQFEGRRIAVLGDMLELGSYSRQAHFEVGKAVAEAKVDLLLVLGEYADDYINGALSSGMDLDRVIKFDLRDLLIDYLKDELSEGDVVLFKASRACSFDTIFWEVKRCLESSFSR